ncbi:sensor protein KdpD [Phocaeicola coprophilus]|jgi:two-component system sensor histidine kinase KdpD|uniref:Sensor protein KdpD n=1 Tax=Phocaeicola coprophilus TaxID=387090 RepID=A0A413SZY1_9BACT|nr:sensor protein KdpD [Phocaeicola coprophilus]RHA75693.1 sensor protein KdpD [Phocaeicola coprophilus]
MVNKEENVRHFLNLIKRSQRGVFKIYIGMIAGVGKTYKMLQEAHEMLDNGIDVQIGYVETHGRVGTEAQLKGLPVIPRKKIFYKGKELEEMDLDAILQLHPELVIVDELAHTNVDGCRNEKRWQDVMDLLEAGINVISAVNIQHIESLNEDIKGIAGIEVKERIPDKVLEEADEVVNIDLTAEELISRLKAGKIYKKEKIQTALNNFFKTENILQLRELALKEVAFRVEKKVETEVVPEEKAIHRELYLACISSNEKTPRHIIRRTARLASRYNTNFIALYVQTPVESPDRINLSVQRHLLNHFKLVTELGGELVQIASPDIIQAIIDVCREHHITTVCIGQPTLGWRKILKIYRYGYFLKNLSEMDIKLIIFPQ